MKKLTIGIPTYNRLQKLENIVSFFKNEGGFSNSDIEFIISDNCSQDGTKEFLNQLNQVYPTLKLNINDKNIGAEGNFCKIIDLASAEFVWLVGDDDELYRGIIDDILKILCTYMNLSWVFIRHNCFLDNGKITTTDLSCDSYYEKGLDLFNLICRSDYKLGGMMFITASVHRTNNAKKAIEIYKNSHEVHNNNMALTLGLAFYSACLGGAAITEKEEIVDDISNVSWTSKSNKVFNRDQIAILDLFAKNVSINLIKDTCFQYGLLNKYPEWRYLKSSSKENNFAMKFYLKNKPSIIIKDLFCLLCNKLKGVKHK